MCYGGRAGVMLAVLVISNSAIAQRTGSSNAAKQDDQVEVADGALRPIISEVLFAVPKGSEGDANGDGVRSATGDEFVEIYNPHDKAIQMKGYRLNDGTPAGAKKNSASPSKSEKKEDTGTPKDSNGARTDNDREHVPFEFVFPEFELGPGQVAVVFNGFESNLTGEVGTAAKAAKVHEKFHGAFVFNAAMASQYAALSNTHDLVQLVSPEGEAIETVTWDYRDNNKGAGGSGGGKGSKAKNDPNAQHIVDKRGDKSGGVVRILPNIRLGSAQVTSVDGEFMSHVAAQGAAFSPGEFKPETDVKEGAKKGKDASKKSDPDD